MEIIGNLTFIGYIVTALAAFVMSFSRLLKDALMQQFAIAGVLAGDDSDLQVITPAFKRVVGVSYILAAAFLGYCLVATYAGWGFPSVPAGIAERLAG